MKYFFVYRSQRSEASLRNVNSGIFEMTIIGSRESTSNRTKASAVRGVAKTVASLRGKTSLKKENIELIPHKPARSESIACKPARVTRNYKHVLSKVG